MRRGKTALFWIILLGMLVILFLLKERDQTADVPFVTSEYAMEMITSGQVMSYRADEGTLWLTLYDGDVAVEYPEPDVLRSLQSSNVAYQPLQNEDSGSGVWLFILLPILLVFFVLYFLFKNASKASGGDIFSLRQAKVREVTDVDKATFGDVGGNQESVELLADVVDFLTHPQRWRSAGARLPRGILLVGPPGTGKTLMARAVAGETKAAFFYTSATEFIEMFVGVGAARVRDTFERAVAQKPSVIFIDELDAIGRRRGASSGTMHEEREQTLNQLLVSMDGLEHHDSLVVMAATNRADVLDPALMRSGRFDRILKVEPPGFDERIEILRIHVREKPVDPGVSLEEIARLTDGFTGADLELLTNNASLLAVRRCRQESREDTEVSLKKDDFKEALREMQSSNPKFDRLDSLLAESVSQFSEPTGRAVVRVTLASGSTLEGEVLWMNTTHMKVRQADGRDVIVSKELAERMEPLAGTEDADMQDFQADRWAGQKIDAR